MTTRHVRLVSFRDASPYHDVLRALAPVVSVAPLHWRPPVDVCEDRASLTVVLEVAGVDEEGVEIELYEDALVIEGERRVETCGRDGFFHAAEIRQGRFHVEVALSDAIDADAVRATYDRGFLRIDLPKQAASSPEHSAPPAAIQRRVEVTDRSDGGTEDAS